MVNSAADLSGLNYRLLRIASDRFDAQPMDLDEQQRREAEAIAAKELLMERAVLTSHEARGVAVPQSQVEQALMEIRSRYEDDESFRLALADNGLKEGDLASFLSRELLVEAVLSVVSSSVPDVDDTEVRLFYYMHPDKFKQPELRTARHILITINPDFPENTRESAEKRLNEVAKRLQKDPRRFNEQAVKHSECPTSLQGGFLGQVKPGTLYPELDSVLFRMKEGEVSDVIESPLGLHLLLCEHVQAARTLPLAEVADLLRDSLTEQKRHRYQRQWLRGLMSEGSSLSNRSHIGETLV
ncbi:MAG: nitrogen fixation protein NifM [Gammaproteobacteria bacterium]|nr:MAG: nitrogen fixation protein NifM [Gammaproteobacteria bacterium]